MLTYADVCSQADTTAKVVADLDELAIFTSSHSAPATQPPSAPTSNNTLTELQSFAAGPAGANSTTYADVCWRAC